MANKKDLDAFDESRKVPEVFSFSESENQKSFLSEDFVFKFEDNQPQTGADLNDTSLGEEDNKKEHIDDEDLDRIRESVQSEEVAEASSSSGAAASSASSATASASSAAASASSTVATVAATTTAAVVLVVGGGVVLGQTLEKPNICNFDEIVVVDNSINFKLSLGNDQDRIDNGEEDTECDITIDLLCPSIEDFEPKQVFVDHFGRIEGEFTELEYDTQYLLNVAQHVMMSTDFEYLLDEPILVQIGSKSEPEPEPEPEPEIAPISLYTDYDPMGGAYWYAEVSNTVEIPAFDSYALYIKVNERGIHFEDGDEPAEEEEEWIAVIDYDVTQMGKQQIFISEDDANARSYYAALYGMTDGKEEVEIVGTTISKADITVSDIDLTQPRVFFMRHITYTMGYTEESYYVYVNYPETVDPDASITGYLTDLNLADQRLPFYVEELNAKCEVDLMFDEYQMSHYAPYNVSITTLDYSTQSEVELFNENVDFNYVPTYYTENPDTNSITIYEESDPMGGKYYYADVHLVTALPTYSSYGIHIKGYNTEPGDTGYEIMSAYDVTEMGKQPLYTSGTLEAPHYEVSFVGIEEVAGEQSVTGIYSETMTPSDFTVGSCDLTYNRIFFSREYDLRTETLHTYAYANVVDDTSEMIRFMGTMTWVESQDASMSFSLDVVNQKTEVELNFDQYSFEDYYIYDVEVRGGTATGGTTTLISETIDYGLVPYKTYTSEDLNNLTIYEELDPAGGYRYYIDLNYYDTLPSDIIDYSIRMKDAEDMDGEWLSISDYDINNTGIQRLNGCLEQLTAEEYYVAFMGIDEDENEAYIFQTLVMKEDFVAYESSDENGLYLLRETNLNTYDNKYYGYLQYDGDTSNLSEISGYIVDVEDQTGSVAAYITMYNFNTVEAIDITWGNASEYATYYVTIQAVDRSDQTSSQLITILDNVVINFGELPQRNVGEALFIGASFTRATSASGQHDYGLIDMNYQDPFNYWSDFQITMTYENEQTSNTYAIVEVATPLNYYYGTSLYYLEGYGVEQYGFTYQISAIVNDDEHTNERMTIYDSEPEQIYGGFYDGDPMNIDGSVTFYDESSTDQTIVGNVLYIRPVFDKNDPSSEFESMELIITNVYDDSETYTIPVDLNDLASPIETTIEYSTYAGNTYEVRTVAYDSSGNEILIFVEEVQFAGA